MNYRDFNNVCRVFLHVNYARCLNFDTRLITRPFILISKLSTFDNFPGVLVTNNKHSFFFAFCTPAK